MRSILIRSLFAVLLAFPALTIPAQASPGVGVAVSVAIAPPDLPVYAQPPCPGDGYIWTPGYWAWDPDFADYYWVPGTWVLAPQPGFFWTPGFWAWGGSGFVFTVGYWGPVVGFYGGINYGFGYFGDGYVGGRWDHGHFFYNTAVSNVNVTVIHNTYRTTVVNNEVTRVSYNGGNGGIAARPTPEQEAAARERHVGPVAAQTQQVNDARNNRDLRASVNHGKPGIAATPRPGDFNGHDTVAAREAGTVHASETNRSENNAVDASRGGNASPEVRSNASASRPVIHPNDIPPAEKPPAPNTGNAKLDQKYQQQQEKLADKQAKENQKLQQRQDQEHQRANQQHANEARQQQMEQRHQQQTQQLVQKHQQENQRLQQRQQPAQGAAPSGHGSAPEKKQ
jgi:hypothetical protein